MKELEVQMVVVLWAVLSSKSVSLVKFPQPMLLQLLLPLVQMQIKIIYMS